MHRSTVLYAAALALTFLAGATPARADFRLCNNTGSRVGIAIGYRDKDGWVTEGWWNVSARSCETILKGQLSARYYYLYAVDYDQGGEWSGKSFMCTREKEFTIRGFENCLARGYDRTGFFEIRFRRAKELDGAALGAGPARHQAEVEPRRPTRRPLRRGRPGRRRPAMRRRRPPRPAPGAIAAPRDEACVGRRRLLSRPSPTGSA